MSQHTYSVWYGSDGYWKTYVKYCGKRKLLKKKSMEDLEDEIIKHIDSTETNFKYCYEQWVKRQEMVGRSPNSIVKYESDYRRFFGGSEFEQMPIEDITEVDIFSHLSNRVVEKDIPYRALKDVFCHMRGTFEKAKRARLIPENPCEYVDLEMLKSKCKEEKRKTARERTVTNQEKNILLGTIGNTDNICFVCIEFSMYTGMRVGEIAGLQWSDIDYDNNTITIRHSQKINRQTNEYYLSDCKNHKIRLFPLTSEIKDVLDKAKKLEMKMGCVSGYVFCDNDGPIKNARISNAARRVTRRKEFESPKCVYSFRRTLNSNMKMNGVPTAVASQLLGHTERVNESNYTYDTLDMAKKMDFVECAYR